MPIRPENRHRYPTEWPTIRAAILERAGHCCEYPGCQAPNRVHIRRYLEQPEEWEPTSYLLGHRQDLGPPILVVLTIAHLDHQPENNDPDNLRAYCQLHHLRHDGKHHAHTARVTRARRAGQLVMGLD